MDVKNKHCCWERWALGAFSCFAMEVAPRRRSAQVFSSITGYQVGQGTVLSCSGLTRLYCSKLRLLWRWPGSVEWDSPEFLEVQEQDGEYMRHSDLQNLLEEQTFPSSQMSLMYVLFTALIRGRLKVFPCM